MSIVYPAGTWIDPNFETQLGTEYKTALDNSIHVGKRITNAFAPHEHPSFGMQVVIEGGYVFDGVTLTETSPQTISSIPAPGGNPRYDRIVIDQLNGAAFRVQGSEAASPVAPGIPAGTSPCAILQLSVGHANILNVHIVDERAGIGGGGSILTREALFAVSINTGESINSLSRIYVETNTANQIVVIVSVAGYTGGTGGKSGTPASSTTVNEPFTINHNLGRIQLLTPSITISSLGNPFTGTLLVHYR